MKLIVLSCGSTAALWGLSLMAAAQVTGLEALAVLTRDKGGAAGAQVVSMSGRRGGEQPTEWRVVARDPAFAGQFREFRVKDGRVVSEHAVPAAESGSYRTAPLARGRVKIDSPVVFWRAHTEAKKALVGFDTVDYQLRNAEFSSQPVWVVGLTNQSGAKVGELAVSAESGNVLRRAWYEAGRQTAPPAGTVSQSQRARTTAVLEETAQQAWQGTRTGWNHGKKAVRTGFSKASTSVGNWLLRAGGGTAAAGTPTPAGPVAPSAAGPSSWEKGTYDSKVTPTTPARP